MHQLGNEEKAALLLTSTDDDCSEVIQSSSIVQHDNNPVISNRPKTCRHHDTNSTDPILLFILILSAFVLGCLSGAFIILYRISQDSEQVLPLMINLSNLTDIDLTIRPKIFQSITRTNFLQLNR